VEIYESQPSHASPHIQKPLDKVEICAKCRPNGSNVFDFSAKLFSGPNCVRASYEEQAKYS
jgi:hypothetical protein